MGVGASGLGRCSDCAQAPPKRAILIDNRRAITDPPSAVPDPGARSSSAEAGAVCATPSKTSGARQYTSSQEAQDSLDAGRAFASCCSVSTTNAVPIAIAAVSAQCQRVATDAASAAVRVAGNGGLGDLDMSELCAGLYTPSLGGLTPDGRGSAAFFPPGAASSGSRTTAPVFTLPDFADADAGGGAGGSERAVRYFVESLTGGVSCKLAVEGIGTLPVEVSLDKQVTTVSLLFNGIKKDIMLTTVRAVAVGRLQIPPGGPAKPLKSASKKAGASAEDVPRLVQLELEDGRFCPIVFDGGNSVREADFFGVCMRVLVEAARFQKAKADLDALGPVKVDDKVAANEALLDLAPHVENTTASSAPGTPNSAEAAGQGNGVGGACVLDGEGGAKVIAALLAAASTAEDEPEAKHAAATGPSPSAAPAIATVDDLI